MGKIALDKINHNVVEAEPTAQSEKRKVCKLSGADYEESFAEGGVWSASRANVSRLEAFLLAAGPIH